MSTKQEQGDSAPVQAPTTTGASHATRLPLALRYRTFSARAGHAADPLRSARRAGSPIRPRPQKGTRTRPSGTVPCGTFHEHMAGTVRRKGSCMTRRRDIAARLCDATINRDGDNAGRRGMSAGRNRQKTGLCEGRMRDRIASIFFVAMRLRAHDERAFQPQ